MPKDGDILAMVKERNPIEIAAVVLLSFSTVVLFNVLRNKSSQEEETTKETQAVRSHPMETMPQGQAPNSQMESTAPDGEVIQSLAPNVKVGKQLPVEYDEGGEGKAPPADTSVALSVMNVQDKYDLHIASPTDLEVFKVYDIIVIADDSSSMREVDKGRKLSRWEELKETLNIVVSMKTCFDEDGVDINFLNRDKLKSVSCTTDAAFVNAFKKEPCGSTPLTRKLSEIVREREAAVENEVAEKPVLLMIFIDGVPDEGAGRLAHVLEDVLSQTTTKLTFRCQILACTSKEEDVGWLKPFDKKLKGLYVTDGYMSEKKEADKKMECTFTRGDWCIKAMLRAVSKKYDSIDEDGKLQQRCLS